MDGLTLAAHLVARLTGAGEIVLDLGTGDGRYVAEQARRNQANFYIGLDACRENLVEISRKAPANSLFLIASGENLPGELTGLIGSITLNFPWGSLLEGLLESVSEVMTGLRMVARPGAKLELRLNESALRMSGRSLETGREQVISALEGAGFAVEMVELLEVTGLKKFPSSWARRLASGREGQVLQIRAFYIPVPEPVTPPAGEMVLTGAAPL